MRKLVPSWATLLLLVALTGCGGGPSIVKVSGQLSYKGKPVPNVELDFVPEKGRPSLGRTDEQGRFELEYDRQQKGALVGKHKVSVRQVPTTRAEQEAVMMGRRPPMTREMAEFFNKYSVDKTTAEVVIERSTSDLQLNWD
ncbi:MAG: DUF4198 domain-containing protein [Gemmataceae bacterium]|nr:DUF4198 domain-containing protein [Gemmataceae bacterium]